jgi:hypothetical protein
MNYMTEDAAELLRIKEELERNLRERMAEVAVLQKRVRSISNILRRLGVQPATSAPPESLGALRTIVRDRWGNPIANVDADSDSIRITPTGLTPIDTRKAPFRSFFIHRVLRPMQDEDEQSVLRGRLSRKEAIHYECREDGGILIELVVCNYGTPQRLERIKDALNWTLEKQQAKRPHST